jgi:hypothetical protein
MSTKEIDPVLSVRAARDRAAEALLVAAGDAATLAQGLLKTRASGPRTVDVDAALRLMGAGCAAFEATR